METVSWAQIFRNFLMGMICLSLSGCSVPIEYFLRNISGSPARIILYKTKKEWTTLEVTSYNSILPINSRTKKLLTHNLETKKISDSTVEIVLTDNSTAHVGKGINFQNFSYYKMIIQHKQNVDTIRFVGYPFKQNKEKLAQFFLYYDIK